MRWNGLSLEGATKASLVLGDVQLTQGGDYSVVVSNDFGRVTSRTAILTVVPPPPLTIAAEGLGFAGGQFAFEVTGRNGQTVVIDASSDLQSWTPVWTNPLSGVVLNFSDPASGTAPNRF